MTHRLAALLSILISLLLPSLAFAADAAHHGPDWFVLGGSFVNAAVLFFLIFKFGGPKVREFLSSRKETIELDINKAAALLASAQAQLAEVERRASSITQELDAIRDEYRVLAQAEHDQIIASAQAQAKRLVHDAQQTILNETLRAKTQIERDLIERATSEAEDALRKQLNPANQQAIIDRYIQSLTAMSDPSFRS
jgi:F-type H+-transporting ATPase subunit b